MIHQGQTKGGPEREIYKGRAILSGIEVWDEWRSGLVDAGPVVVVIHGCPCGKEEGVGGERRNKVVGDQETTASPR